MQNARLNEEKARINTARRNIIILRYADDTILMAEREKELKMKVKEKSENAGLELSIQKMKLIASNPINSWQIDRETLGKVSVFILWAPKSLQMVTAAMKLKDVCSLEEIL